MPLTRTCMVATRACRSALLWVIALKVSVREWVALARAIVASPASAITWAHLGELAVAVASATFPVVGAASRQSLPMPVAARSTRGGDGRRGLAPRVLFIGRSDCAACGRVACPACVFSDSELGEIQPTKLIRASDPAVVRDSSGHSPPAILGLTRTSLAQTSRAGLPSDTNPRRWTMLRAHSAFLPIQSVLLASSQSATSTCDPRRGNLGCDEKKCFFGKPSREFA